MKIFLLILIFADLTDYTEAFPDGKIIDILYEYTVTAMPKGII